MFNMNQYCVNNTSDKGVHEVHEKGCPRWPMSSINLGYHYDCRSAIVRARKYFSPVDGCFTCSRECHTR